MHYVMMDRQQYDVVSKLCHRNALADKLLQTAQPVTNELLDDLVGNTEADLTEISEEAAVFNFNETLDPPSMLLRTEDPVLLQQLRQEVHSYVEAAEPDVNGNYPEWFPGFQLLESRLIAYLTKTG